MSSSRAWLVLAMSLAIVGCLGDGDETPAWLEEARAQRQQVQTDYPELFAEVSRLLFEADPIGINFIDNTDEYDAEAGSIIPRLPSCTSADDVRRVVHEEFVRWFSPETAGDPDRYDEVSKQIWAAWQKCIGSVAR